MSNDKMTLEDWVSKAAWEGGLIPALEYGLTYEDLDDEGRASDFGVALKDLQAAWPLIEAAEQALQDAAEDLDIEY